MDELLFLRGKKAKGEYFWEVDEFHDEMCNDDYFHLVIKFMESNFAA